VGASDFHRTVKMECRDVGYRLCLAARMKHWKRVVEDRRTSTVSTVPIQTVYLWMMAGTS